MSQRLRFFNSPKERNWKVDVPINFFLKMAKKPFALRSLPSAKSPSGRNFYSDGGVSPSENESPDFFSFSLSH